MSKGRKKQIFAAVVAVFLLGQSLSGLVPTGGMAEGNTALGPMVTNGAVVNTDGVTLPFPDPQGPTGEQRPTTAPATGEPTATAIPENSEAPETTATPQITATPQSTPAPENTETTQTPAPQEPTPTPPAQPGETDLPLVDPGTNPNTPQPTLPGEGQWDEAFCDHANPNCIEAPGCDIPGHEHIAYDVHTLPYPTCDLGMWLLDREDRITRSHQVSTMQASILRMGRVTAEIDLAKGDATIYRSGNYIIKNGRNGAGTVTVKNSRIVTLYLENTNAQHLVMEKQVQATMVLKGQNSWQAWAFPEDGQVRFIEGGALTVKNTVEATNSYFYVDNGSVNLTGVKESGGNRLFAFPSEGTTAATIGGQVVADTPDVDAYYYLWLPPVGEGFSYQATVKGDYLDIVQTIGAENLPDPPSEENQWTDDQGNVKYINIGTSEHRVFSGLLEGENTQFEIRFQGNSGSATLNNVKLPAGSTLSIVNSNGENSLYFNGQEASVTIENSRKLNIMGNCSQLNYRTNGGSADIKGGNLFWQGVTEGVQVLGQEISDVIIPSGQINSETVFLHQGTAMPLVWTGPQSFLAPQSIANDYRFVLESNVIQTLPREDGEGIIHLFGSSDEISLSIAIKGDIHIIGDGSPWAGKLTLGEEYQGTVTLENVIINHVELLAQNDITFNLVNANEIKTFTGGGDGQVQFIGKGNLTIGSWQANPSSVNAQKANVQLGGGASFQNQVKTQVVVHNGEGQILSNQLVTLRVGKGEPYQTQTFSDGTLWLWSPQILHQQDIAVSDGKNIYTAVIVGGQGDLSEVIEITGVQGTSPGRAATITFAAPQGNTLGVMYVAGAAQQNLEDTYVPTAQIVYGTKDRNGNCEITLPQTFEKGQVISYRVFASVAQGADLQPATIDGFQFSPLHTLTVEGKEAFEVQNILPDAKFYDGEGYAFTNVPAGITLTFTTMGGKVLAQPPVNAGSYKALFEVPQNHPDYFAGSYEKTIMITKTKNPVQVSVVQTTYGQKLQTQIAGNLGGEPFVVYRGLRETSYQSSTPPTFVGNYEVVVTIAGSENVDDIEVVMPFNIYPKKVYILPVPNQMKIAGEEDPLFPFYYDGIIDGDEWLLEGFLFRAIGEEPGAYPYTVRYLSAGENYIFELHPYSDEFTILPGEDNGDDNGGDDGGDGGDGGGGGGGTGDGKNTKIIPVHQKIKLQNGKTLDVVLNTTQVLTINGRDYSRLIWDTEDNKVRYFNPSFRITEDLSQVMLNLETEPELKKDGGYLTDFDGRKVYQGRRLELSYATLGKLKELGITHINLGNKNASALMGLDDLINLKVTELAKEEKSTIQRAVFHITIWPQITTEKLTAPEQQALAKANIVGEVYRLEVEMVLGDSHYDIAPLLDTLQFQIGVEDILKVMDIPKAQEATEDSTATGAKGKIDEADPKANPDDKKEGTTTDGGEAQPKAADKQWFELINLSPQGKEQKNVTLFIEPFMESEKQMVFQMLRGTQRYCTTPATQGGIYYLNFIKNEAAKEPAKDAPAAEPQK